MTFLVSMKEYCEFNYFQAFGIFDPTYHGMMRAFYDVAINEYGRKAGSDSIIVASSTDAATATDARFVSFILLIIYCFV